METSTSRPVLVGAGLVLSMFCSSISGIDMAFSVYAVLLKDTFNFTQTQVELTASMGTVGIGLSFLETVITGAFGYRITFILCWLLMPLGAGSISLAARYKEFFAGLPVSIYAAQLIMSTSNCVAHVAIVQTNIDRFSSQHSGKLIGMYWAMGGAGKIMFASLIDLFFSENLAGFFFAVSLITLVLYGVCFVVLHLAFPGRHKASSSLKSKETLPQENKFVTAFPTEKGRLKLQAKNRQEEGTLSAAKTPLLAPDKSKQLKPNFSTSGYESNPPKNEETLSSLNEDCAVPPKTMLSSLSFHLIFWPSVFFYSAAYTVMNNITSVSVSAGMHNLMSTVYVISICIIFTRILCGLIYDKYPVLLCGVVLLSVSYVCFAAAMVVGMFVIDERTAYIVTVLSGIGLGPGMSISIALLTARFGKSNYSKVTVAFLALQAVLELSFQVFVGVAYDSHSNGQQVERFICYGQKCFFWSFALMLLITIVALILQWLNYAVNRKKQDT